MSWWSDLLENRRLRPQTVAHVDQGGARPGEMGDALRSWLTAAFGGGDGAEVREAAALARLRADPDRALADISAAYQNAPERHYALRWALVYAAGKLQTVSALAFLERVLADAIPPEQSHDIHLFSTVAEETSLRCRAVEGIASLAAMPHAGAQSALVKQLRHPSFTVCVTATLALRALPGRPIDDDEIRRLLPGSEAERVFAIRRITVQDLETPVEPGPRRTTPRPPGGLSGTDLRVPEQRRPPRAGGA